GSQPAIRRVPANCWLPPFPFRVGPPAPVAAIPTGFARDGQSRERSRTPGRTDRSCCRRRKRGSAVQDPERNLCRDKPSGRAGSRTGPLPLAQARSRIGSLRKTSPVSAAYRFSRLERKCPTIALRCCRALLKQNGPFGPTESRCQPLTPRLIVVVSRCFWTSSPRRQ